MVEKSVDDASNAIFGLLEAQFVARDLDDWPFTERQPPDPREVTVETLLRLVFRATGQDPTKGLEGVESLSGIREPFTTGDRHAPSTLTEAGSNEVYARRLSQQFYRVLRALAESGVLSFPTVLEMLKEGVDTFPSEGSGQDPTRSVQ